MKKYINLLVWFAMAYILIEVSIQHLQPFWLGIGAVVFIADIIWLFNSNKSE